MTLLNFIKSKQARLLFGKKELEIIEKQLFGLELKPSEKTRLSRDIKKKFEAIEKISNYKKEFKLKKRQEINFIIENAKETILEKYPEITKEIILFGSFATKTNKKTSDIDICLKLNKTKQNPTRIRAHLLGELDAKIDLHIYSELPKKIRDKINIEGKVLFNNEKN